MCKIQNFRVFYSFPLWVFGLRTVKISMRRGKSPKQKDFFSYRIWKLFIVLRKTEVVKSIFWATPWMRPVTRRKKVWLLQQNKWDYSQSIATAKICYKFDRYWFLFSRSINSYLTRLSKFFMNDFQKFKIKNFQNEFIQKISKNK